MDGDKAALYGAIIGLAVFGVLLVLVCVLCKYCLTSRKAQTWSGLDNILGRAGTAKHQDETVYNKNITSHESEFMLKMQQGDYVGYDTMEREISIPKLPDFISRKEETNGNNYHHQSIAGAVPTPAARAKTALHGAYNIQPPPNIKREDCDSSTESADTPASRTESSPSGDEAMDMTNLKSGSTAHLHTKHSRHAAARYDIAPAHPTHHSYTIYEETSDLSGNESGATINQTCMTGQSDSASQSSDDDSLSGVSVDSLVHSNSLQSFGSSVDLLEHHVDDSGLGQVEYTLLYHREASQLVLHIIQAKNLELPCNPSGDLPDTFIKTFAADCHDHDPKKQTKICKATANPIFKENFIFRIDFNEFYTASITLQVFSRDQYARQKLLGEICIALLPLCCTENYRTWSNILDYDHQPLGSCAEVKVGLLYNHSTEELTVLPTELRSLKLEFSPVYTTKEIYLAVTLLTEPNHPKAKKKTINRSITSSCHTAFIGTNALTFHHLHNTTIHETKLLIELCEEHPDKSHDTIGYAILGAGTTDTEYGHWLLMDSNASLTHPPEQDVAMWHNIHCKPVRSKYKPPHFNLR